MQALLVTPGSPGTTRLEEVPAPRYSSGEVLVRVLEIGICGTDREIDRGQVGVAPAGSRELVIGHEVLGAVERAGAGFSAGELVTATVRRPCPSCSSCLAGSPDACLSGEFTERGIKGLHGFASEVFVESPDNLVHIPTALGRLGVLTEPMSICERAVRHARVVGGRQGWELRTAIVVGVGSIGMLTTLLLRLAGVETWALSRSLPDSNKAELVRATGAVYTSTSEASPLDVARDLGGADLVVEATGDAGVMAQCLGAAGVNGVVCLLGVDPVEHDVVTDSRVLSGFVTGNRALIGSVNAHSSDWRSAVARLEQIDSRWPGLLTGMIGLTVAPERFRDALDFGGIKATVRFG